MTYTQNNRMNESESNVTLDNQVITVKEFNEALENLKPNQRVIESSDHNFHTVERFYD